MRKRQGKAYLKTSNNGNDKKVATQIFSNHIDDRVSDTLKKNHRSKKEASQQLLKRKKPLAR